MLDNRLTSSNKKIVQKYELFLRDIIKNKVKIKDLQFSSNSQKTLITITQLNSEFEFIDDTKAKIHRYNFNSFSTSELDNFLKKEAEKTAFLLVKNYKMFLENYETVDVHENIYNNLDSLRDIVLKNLEDIYNLKIKISVCREEDIYYFFFNTEDLLEIGFTKQVKDYVFNDEQLQYFSNAEADVSKYLKTILNFFIGKTSAYVIQIVQNEKEIQKILKRVAKNNNLDVNNLNVVAENTCFYVKSLDNSYCSKAFTSLFLSNESIDRL